MDRIDKAQILRSRISAVLTDIQFWVPVAVLVLGLLILKVLRQE